MNSVTRTGIALASLATFGLFATAFAAPPAGSRWTGALTSPGSDVGAAILTVQDAQNASLRVGAPANCDIPMTLIGEQNGATAYNLRQNRNGGAFCDRMIGGRAQLTPTNDGRLILDMVSPRNNMPYRAVLTPAIP